MTERIKNDKKKERDQYENASGTSLSLLSLRT